MLTHIAGAERPAIDHQAGRTVPAGTAPSVALLVAGRRHGVSPGTVLDLQRIAGNAAVVAAIAGQAKPDAPNGPTALQRACGCGGSCGHCGTDPATPDSDELLANRTSSVQRKLNVVSPGANIPNPGGAAVVQTNG